MGAPYFRLICAIAPTSASSVGVVLGKMISVGAKPSRSSLAITSPIDNFSAVASIRRTSHPASRSSAAASASVYGGLVRSEERRVGKECRSRGAPYHLKKKKKSVLKEEQLIGTWVRCGRRPGAARVGAELLS